MDKETVEKGAREARSVRKSKTKPTATLNEISQFLNALASIATVVGLFFIYGSLKATADGNEAANRAWLDVDSVKFNWTTDGKTQLIPFSITNTGHEPAQSVMLSMLRTALIRPADGRPFDAQIPNNALCGQNSISHGIVFSNAPEALVVSFPPMSKFYISDKMINAGYIEAFYGCVTYRTFQKVHSTRFCYYQNYDPSSSSFIQRRCSTQNTAD